MKKLILLGAAAALSAGKAIAEQAGPVVETAVEKSAQNATSGAGSLDNPNITLWILAAVAAFLIASNRDGS